MATNAQQHSAKTAGRMLQGVVVSDRMDKTVVVRVERRSKHARYHKYTTHTRRYKAHDETNACRTGETVFIRESRPWSRDKHWIVVRRDIAAGAAEHAQTPDLPQDTTRAQ